MDRSRLLYPRLTWTEDEYRIAEQMAREGNCWAQYEMARYIMGNRSIPEDAWQLSGEDAQSYLFWLKRAASAVCHGLNTGLPESRETQKTDMESTIRSRLSGGCFWRRL